MNNVVQLDFLGRRIRSGINRDDSRFVKNVRVNPAGCTLAERCDELADAFFRKKKIRGKRVCSHFSQLIPFALAAHHANRVLVQQDVGILMGPGKAASFARMSVINDNKRSDLRVADREA